MQFRSRCQFTLKQLLLLVTAVAIAVGAWSASGLRRTHQRLAAISKIEKLGGAIMFAHERSPHGAWVENAVSPGNPWVKRFLGRNYAVEVVEVHLFNDSSMHPNQFTDADAQELAVLTELQWLDLSDTNVTDEGLVYFSRMRNLERLDLEGTRVTEAGVNRLKKDLPNVEVFY